MVNFIFNIIFNIIFKNKIVIHKNIVGAGVKNLILKILKGMLGIRSISLIRRCLENKY